MRTTRCPGELMQRRLLLLESQTACAVCYSITTATPADLSSSQSAVGVRARVCAQPQCLCSLLCACAQCAGVRCGAVQLGLALKSTSSTSLSSLHLCFDPFVQSQN